MLTIIEELFYNNIDPQARMVRNGSNLRGTADENAERRRKKAILGVR